MNILLTGCNGFIGRELIQHFSKSEHKVFATNRQSLDVSKESEVDSFFDQNKIDVVIHTAVKGGKRNTPDIYEDLVSNLVMFSNLKKYRDKFKLMINFGSGAEFDRELEIDDANENDLDSRMPKDYYGLSKNLISREINRIDDNIVNFRLFGCFGPLEASTRLIKSSVFKCLNKEPIIVHQDRKMDFFYIQDLIKVIEYYMENVESKLPTDVNMCYRDKHTLVEITNSVLKYTKSKSDVIIKAADVGNSYSGSSRKLDSFGLNLVGLEEGIRQIVKCYNA